MPENRYSKVFGTNREDRLKAPNFLRTAQGKQKNIPSHSPQHKPKFVSKPAPPKKHGLLDMLNLSNIEMDSDRSMLLMMLALLSGNDSESDELLMLALMYIML